MSSNSSPELPQRDSFGSTLRTALLQTGWNYLLASNSRTLPLKKMGEYLLQKGLNPEEVNLLLEFNKAQHQREIVLKRDDSLLTRFAGQPSLGDRSAPLFTRISNLLVNSALWAALLYGLYMFYRNHIVEKDEEKECALVENVQQVNQEVNIIKAKLFELIKTVETVQDFNIKYRGRRDEQLLMLKTELTSIKALLVNRNQFADIPLIPKLPDWQIDACKKKTSKPNSMSEGEGSSSE